MKRTMLRGILVLTAAAMLAACGGSSPAAAPSAVHSAASGEPALIQVAGYQYGDPDDPTLQQAVTDQLAQLNELMPGYYTTGSVHSVITDGAGELVIMELGLGTEAASLMGESISGAAGVVTGVAGPGATVTTDTMSTQPVASAQYSQDGTDMAIYSWVHDGIVTMVMGEDAAQTKAFVEAYLATAHS